jgi:aminopeptidase
MRDSRIDQLATLLVNHSCSLGAGEKVLIEAIGIPAEMVVSLVRAARAAGAIPLVHLKDDQIIRAQCLGCDEPSVRLMADCELYTLRQMDAFIGLRGFANIGELADVPHEKMRCVWEHYLRPVHLQQRNRHTKWVFTRWPTPAAAQRAGMSTEALEDYYFRACLVDYGRMEQAMSPLAELMARTDTVRLLGPGDTDVSFSIRGIPACLFTGYHNVPDGELMIAPIRDSVRGRIHYNVPSTFYGTTFRDIRFEFRDGRIVVASCNHTEKLHAILDQDEGARYIGEFAFGCNPLVARRIDDSLIDEKMRGTVHLTPGNAYRECDNGNRSSIHWDLIVDQTPECGGGTVFFDGVPIRENGRFVLSELQTLNPENMGIC